MSGCASSTRSAEPSSGFLLEAKGRVECTLCLGVCMCCECDMKASPTLRTLAFWRRTVVAHSINRSDPPGLPGSVEWKDSGIF